LFFDVLTLPATVPVRKSEQLLRGKTERRILHSFHLYWAKRFYPNLAEHGRGQFSRIYVIIGRAGWGGLNINI
jgi:hypothetical protein